VLLGLMWGLWHLPFDGLGVLGPALLAVPFTWLWNRTGSLLLCSVLHAAVVASQDHLVLTDSGAPATSPAIRLGFDQRPGPVAARVADIGHPAGDGPAG
jgi:membrane protease YdiL (CAAX protease family)